MHTFWAGHLLATTLILGAAAPALAAPETISVALPGDIPSLVPSLDSSPLGFNYRLNVFDQLTEVQRDGSIAPRLATEWSVSDDLLTWTFTIRDDAVFHNGTRVTAHDVAYSTRNILNNPQSPTRTFLSLVEDVEATDDYTVVYTLNQPYAIFERQISFINIISQSYHEEVGAEGYASEPIGSGPYRVVDWVRDDRLELAANENYWKGTPAIKSATFRPIPAEAGRASALASGGVDLVTSLPPALIDTLDDASGIETGVARGSRAIFLGFNVNVPPLDDPAIREAIDLAIDRKAITDELLRGLGEPASMMIPPNNVGYNAELEPVVQDMERAQELVKGSGYEGETITIEYPSNNIVLANETVQAIAGYMTEAGLSVEIAPSEFTAFFPKWAQTEMDSMYLFAYGSTQYHADTILTAMYEEGSRIYKVNEQIDALVKEQRQIVDPEEQTAVIGEIFTLGAADRYNIPIYYEYNAYGMTEGLSYEPWPDGFVRLYDFD